MSEQAVIQNSIMNLSGYPWVRERMEDGKLKIHGMHFDFEHGRLTRLDYEGGAWVDVRQRPDGCAFSATRPLT